MEIGIDENIRTYSGGLDILAGDTIRSAADLNVSSLVTAYYAEAPDSPVSALVNALEEMVAKTNGTPRA